MKKTIFIITLSLLFANSTFGQVLNGKIGFSFSVLNFGNQYANTEIPQENAIVNDGFLAFSVDYFYPLGKSGYELETGLGISRHSLTKYPFVINANDNNQKTRYAQSLMYVPFGIRKSFLKYGFVNGGFLLNANYKVGLGSYLGIGVKVDSPIGLTLYINPYVRAHSVIGFDKNKNQFIDRGIKIGLTYPLDKLLEGEGRGF